MSADPSLYKTPFLRFQKVATLTTVILAVTLVLVSFASYIPRYSPVSRAPSLGKSVLRSKRPSRTHKKALTINENNYNWDGKLYSERKENIGKLIVFLMRPKYRKYVSTHAQTCGKHLCLFTSDSWRVKEADAVIVNIFMLSRKRVKPKPERSGPNQVWIFKTKEPWLGYSQRFPKEWEGVFNWSMTYYNNSDLEASYGRLEEVQNNAEVDWEEVLNAKTTSVLWYVSHCNTSSLREKYVEELKKYIHVTIVGRCGQPTCVLGGKVHNLTTCYKKHRFYLAFESTYCDDYVTEKFFRTFPHHIVPIVRGKVNYAKVFPKDSFINTEDFASPKALASYLHALEKDPPRYLQHLQHHAKYQYKHVFSTCDVCSRLYHLDKFRRSYASVSEWMDRCSRPKQPY